MCVSPVLSTTNLIQMRHGTKGRDRPTSSLVSWILHLITMLQWVPLPWAGLCLCLSDRKPDWLPWMRILRTGCWHVVYRPVLSPFTPCFSAHTSEDSSSSMAPGDVLWHGGGWRKRGAAKWIQGWAKRSFQRRLQKDRERERERERESERETGCVIVSQFGFPWIEKAENYALTSCPVYHIHTAATLLGCHAPGGINVFHVASDINKSLAFQKLPHQCVSNMCSDIFYCVTISSSHVG